MSSSEVSPYCGQDKASLALHIGRRVGEKPKSDGNRSALHKTKTFIAAFAVDSHRGAIAGKISFRTAVDLNSQANALLVSAIPSRVDRSKHFFYH